MASDPADTQPGLVVDYVLVVSVPDGLLVDDSIESVTRIVNEALQEVEGPFAFQVRPLSEIMAC